MIKIYICRISYRKIKRNVFKEMEREILQGCKWIKKKEKVNLPLKQGEKGKEEYDRRKVD